MDRGADVATRYLLKTRKESIEAGLVKQSFRIARARWLGHSTECSDIAGDFTRPERTTDVKDLIHTSRRRG